MALIVGTPGVDQSVQVIAPDGEILEELAFVGLDDFTSAVAVFIPRNAAFAMVAVSD